MAIGYKDFFPTMLKSGFFSNDYEPLSATVARANLWLRESAVRVLNVETVVLPNVKNEEKASEVGIRTSGEMSSYWFQIVRVWYETEEPPIQ
jgi:hypothetical protein